MKNFPLIVCIEESSCQRPRSVTWRQGIVADGFEATPNRIADTLTDAILPWAGGGEKEVTARAITSPSPAEIAKLQSGEVVASD